MRQLHLVTLSVMQKSIQSISNWLIVNMIYKI